MKKDITDTINRINRAGFELVDYNGEHLYTHSKHLMKCKLCGEVQERYINTVINLSGKCRCTSKISSNGENIIKDILDNYNIKYITNKTFDGMVSESSLRCDFFIPEYNAVIEYDGIQHFIERDNLFYHDTLETIQNRDITKNNFCAKNNIPILRISYKERNMEKIARIIKEFLNLDNKIDGKPYDGKLSRTVWVGGKSNYEEYLMYNSK